MAENKVLPKQVESLIKQRSEAMRKIDDTYCRELKRLKIVYTKKGDLDTANAILNLIGKIESEGFDSEILNKKWTWRTARENAGNWFKLNSDGTGVFSASQSIRWRKTGLLSIEMTFVAKRGKKATLEWSEDRSRYSGIGLTGAKIMGNSKK